MFAQQDQKNKEIMAKNIRYLMKKNNVRARNICKDLDIKPNTFSDWINAKIYPRVDKIELLADYFNVPKAFLTSSQEEINIIYSQKKDEVIELLEEMNSEFKKEFSEAISTDDFVALKSKITAINQAIYEIKLRI